MHASEGVALAEPVWIAKLVICTSRSIYPSC